MKRIATDIGGTFTDLVTFDENDGSIEIYKSLTTPNDPSIGLLKTLEESGLRPNEAATFVHGNTTVINAITERKGVKTALITTAGFRDLIEIARGNRPDLYNLRFYKETPFVPRKYRFEVKERISSNGDILEVIQLSDLEYICSKLKQFKIEAVAIAFLHGYANTTHELLAEEFISQRLPEIPITSSHSITREWREYERTNTTILNSYVRPIVSRYIENLEASLEQLTFNCKKFAMQSNGGTASFASAKKVPITLVESGPAAGVNGAVLIGKLCKEPNIIYLDIGGTTAKCSVIKDYQTNITTEYKLEHSKTQFGYPVRVPVVDIVEIGTGGGSIAFIDDAGVLKVGPESAGGYPGPASYGLGGDRATVTDAKLLTGVINPNNFAAGQFSLDKEAAKIAVGKLAEKLKCTVEEAAVSIIRLGDAAMINALKLVSLQRGHDPRDFVLIVGGGGGPMHAAALAAELGVKKVTIPLYPALFSAWGMLASEPKKDFVKTQLSKYSELKKEKITAEFESLKIDAVNYFQEDLGVSEQDLKIKKSCDLRYSGQEHAVEVPVKADNFNMKELLENFHEIHEKTYTFKLASTDVELVTYRLTAAANVPHPEVKAVKTDEVNIEDAVRSERLVHFGEYGQHKSKIYDRNSLKINETFLGPAIIEEPTSTTIALPGQKFYADIYGFLHIEKDQ